MTTNIVKNNRKTYPIENNRRMEILCLEARDA